MDIHEIHFRKSFTKTKTVTITNNNKMNYLALGIRYLMYKVKNVNGNISNQH
jgi:hypothetical protein